MVQSESPSAMAAEFHSASAQSALAAFEAFLGAALPGARSPLIQYRSKSDFQQDWREEVGHWLLAAQQGFSNPPQTALGIKVYEALANRA